jgi:hypothetical protein
MRSPLLLLPLLIGLAACESQTSADSADANASGTNINVAAKGDKGEDIRITADGDTGKVSVNLPGFDANVRLPKVMLKDSNFDIDGVKLYPGSTVASINVQGDTSGAGDKSRVQIIYTAPAEPKPVRDWFVKAFAEKAVVAKISGESLTGTSKDGTPFTMTFTPGKGGSTTGIVVLDAKNPA